MQFLPRGPATDGQEGGLGIEHGVYHGRWHDATVNGPERFLLPICNAARERAAGRLTL